MLKISGDRGRIIWPETRRHPLLWRTHSCLDLLEFNRDTTIIFNWVMMPTRALWYSQGHNGIHKIIIIILTRSWWNSQGHNGTQKIIMILIGLWLYPIGHNGWLWSKAVLTFTILLRDKWKRPQTSNPGSAESSSLSLQSCNRRGLKIGKTTKYTTTTTHQKTTKYTTTTHQKRIKCTTTTNQQKTYHTTTLSQPTMTWPTQ